MEPLLGHEGTKSPLSTAENKVLSELLLELQGGHWGSEVLWRVYLWDHSIVHLHLKEKKIQQSFMT